MRRLDGAIIVDSRAADGVVVQPVDIDQAIERPHDLTRGDVDHVVGFGAEATAALDDQELAVRVELPPR